MSKNPKILIIQTAFIGDVILATSLIEYLKKQLPGAHLDFFLRKGNQSIIETSPYINKVYIWDKSKNKTLSLISHIFEIRKEKYDYVINIQRFFNSGLLTALSGAKTKIGFQSNPLSFLFDKKITHLIPYKIENSHYHEVQRNILLVESMIPNFSMPNDKELKPKIYFTEEDQIAVNRIIKNSSTYFVMAPASVWYTKQWHIDRWKELVSNLKGKGDIYLIGAPSDKQYLEHLSSENVHNIAGELSLRQSALLMKNAKRVFVNDSAPLHLASSVNAKTTAIFCSTVPEFGYYPLSDDEYLIQVSPRLECMPCGLHGHKSCPKEHFKCSSDIDMNQVLNSI
jgi:ADP-heptose:LPS heptosyltransferase